MDQLDKKVFDVFSGRVVPKGATKKIKDSANVPTYVLEYLLGNYCTSDDEGEVEAGIEQVKRILADNYVRPDEAEQIKVFAEMKKAPMSVRQIESMAKQLSEGGSVKAKSGKRIRQKGSNLSADYNLLREGLRKIFRTKVEMTCSQTGKGKISIPFANESELERIIEMFDKLRS